MRQWAPAFENYTFSDSGSGTRVRIDIDVSGDFENCMTDSWPKALAKLKAMCEQH